MQSIAERRSLTELTEHFVPSPVASAAATHRHIALLLTDLNGGGVQKMTLSLAGGLIERGHSVTLVLYSAHGALRSQVPDGAAVRHLTRSAQVWARLGPLLADPLGLPSLLRPVIFPKKPPPGLSFLRSLAQYLRHERPDALISAAPSCNLAAVWAKRLSGARTIVLVSEHTAPSKMLAKTSTWRVRHLPPVMRRAYQQADVIVAVSHGLGDDLADLTGIPRDRIRTVYDPVVGNGLTALADEPLDHPWFAPGQPPVILTAGRLSAQKDFPTLLRAFARVRQSREARLVILGAATDDTKTEVRQGRLLATAASLGVASDVALLGFVANPYAYMARAALFVLSSAWEGFGVVLAEAMACGCPVVSTDCVSGPAEILDGGRYGPLVPVGDDAALAAAIQAVLDNPPDPELLRRRAKQFTVGLSVDGYLRALFG